MDYLYDHHYDDTPGNDETFHETTSGGEDDDKPSRAEISRLKINPLQEHSFRDPILSHMIMVYSCCFGIYDLSVETEDGFIDRSVCDVDKKNADSVKFHESVTSDNDESQLTENKGYNSQQEGTPSRTHITELVIIPGTDGALPILCEVVPVVSNNGENQIDIYDPEKSEKSYLQVDIDIKDEVLAESASLKFVGDVVEDKTTHNGNGPLFPTTARKLRTSEYIVRTAESAVATESGLVTVEASGTKLRETASPMLETCCSQPASSLPSSSKLNSWCLTDVTTPATTLPSLTAGITTGTVDYHFEVNRLASYHSAPRHAKFDAVMNAKDGLWYTGLQDTAACYKCTFRHWDWRSEQFPNKLHRDNQPNCPVARCESQDNIPYEPRMLLLSENGKQKVSQVIQSLLRKQMALEQSTEDAKERLEHDKQLLEKATVHDSAAVHHRLSEAPLGDSSRTSTPDSDSPTPTVGATKIIYYALEYDRNGQPRCVPHIVDPKATVAQKSGVPDELRNEKNRIDSYKKWSNPPFSVYDYARNGFFYTGNNRDIKCAFCGGVMAIPTNLRRFTIAAKHKRAFPTCPLVLNLEVGNVPLPVDPKLQTPKLNTEQHRTETVDYTGIEHAILTMKFPQFSDEQNRSLSFMSWPAHFPQKTEVLVECGFFCLGDGDSVRCFHCGGGLRNWEPTDDPWREHARWFPRCDYLQQKKGISFVRRVREESDVSAWVASMSQTNEAVSTMNLQSTGTNALKQRHLNLSNSGIPTPAPTTPRFPNGVTEPSVVSKGVQWRFQPREIRARMDTTGVRRLMNMGYSPVLIRFSIVTQLRDTGKDFQQLSELAEAVLDLEPVAEKYGELFLETVLKNKYDLDPLPSVLKESYYKIVDDSYVSERRIPVAGARPNVTTDGSNNITTTTFSESTGTTSTTGGSSGVVTTTESSNTEDATRVAPDQQHAQEQRLESNTARIRNQGQSRNDEDEATGGASESEAPSHGRKGRKSRGKRATSTKGPVAAASGMSDTTNKSNSASSSQQATTELAEENKRANEECRICMDKTIDCVLIPCGHLAVCINCARSLSECPICRKTIRSRQKIFHT